MGVVKEMAGWLWGYLQTVGCFDIAVGWREHVVIYSNLWSLNRERLMDGWVNRRADGVSSPSPRVSLTSCVLRFERKGFSK